MHSHRSDPNDISSDPEKRAYLLSADPKLSSLLHKPLKTLPEPGATLFLDICSCILDQQIRYLHNGWRVARLIHLLENAPITPTAIQGLSDSHISNLKLSKTKLQGLMSLSRIWKEQSWGTLPWTTLSEEVVISLLGSVHGISEATIELLLLYSLQKDDVLPVNVRAFRRAMSAWIGDPSLEHDVQTLQIQTVQWRPYRSFVARHLLELHKKQ